MVKLFVPLAVFILLFLVMPAVTANPTEAEIGAQPVVAGASAVRQQQAATCTNPYTVVAGDTLTGIAASCGVTYASLVAANPGITNVNLIFPGQKITIPNGGIPNTGGSTYTVVAGDRLFRIALRFNTTVAAIVAANPQITNPNLIFPGQVINIPSGGIPNTGGSTYTVVAGDTLFSIARRNGITLAALLAANPQITNENLIFPGQVINIP